MCYQLALIGIVFRIESNPSAKSYKHGLWIIDVCPVNNSSMESVMAGQFCNGKITHCSFQFDYGLNAYWRRSRRGYHASAEGVMGILVYVTWTQLWYLAYRLDRIGLVLSAVQICSVKNVQDNSLLIRLQKGLLLFRSIYLVQAGAPFLLHMKPLLSCSPIMVNARICNFACLPMHGTLMLLHQTGIYLDEIWFPTFDICSTHWEDAHDILKSILEHYIMSVPRVGPLLKCCLCDGGLAETGGIICFNNQATT
ncbi:hypothetical protein KY290_035073 [Solanum tuberosum]|uniref:Uncharacterized protein n=1 Tax=Solanum tuberosum TaxID=4113 RepID=A0ABQ7U532_SOLTU|nr:hypothetical protein KY289_034569 [Solanum tuberosum]KAH0646929.1 hypothetical protein KY284_034813 [Solanum tuberosum]KAH0649094.1 hypothetical protein KY285_034342 [Solanum tuberosum]KAH0742030.1 hypothetical protein KY290_035073 [Solanum tuberosum]